MDAVKFLQEWRRLCLSMKAACDGCPMHRACDRELISAVIRTGDEGFFREMAEIVEKWCAEHPRKTRLMDFMEKHPNARLQLEIRMPFMTPAVLGYCGTKHCNECEHEHYTMAHCWNLPLEDA